MRDEEKINPGHTNVRNVLRIAGPITIAVGGLFVVIGIGSFFSAFAGSGSPRYFWCAFVGMPIVFFGIVMTMFGFLGAVTRYQAGEVAPVGKDTFNYMAHGTQGGVRMMASAVGAGLAEGSGGGKLACPACGHPNDQDAKFCDDCGAAISKACPGCGAVNDGDAKFCDDCGKRFPTVE